MSRFFMYQQLRRMVQPSPQYVYAKRYSGHALAEPEAGDGRAAKKTVLVVHAHGFIIPCGTHRHHQGQQMVFLRMGHAGDRRVLPVDQPLRTLVRIGGDQGGVPSFSVQ